MITFILGFTLGIIVGVTGLVCVAIMYDKHHPGRLERSNSMLTRNKKLKDYGIPAEDIEKLNTMLKDFPTEYGYLLTSAALSACPKNTVIADMVVENILHRKSYRKISRERYIPMNPKDFYGYRRKTVAVLYERMRLLGVWEGE